MPLPLNDRQFAFWRLRRSGLPNIQIADRFKISRQAVSKALLAMDRKVEETLIDMAQANQIEVERLNAELGVLFGRSVPFDTAAVVFVSADHGVQVWYEHEGDCGTCSQYARCIELLWGYADELGITLDEDRRPDPSGRRTLCKTPGDGMMPLLETIRAYLGWCPMAGAMRPELAVRSAAAAAAGGQDGPLRAEPGWWKRYHNQLLITAIAFSAAAAALFTLVEDAPPGYPAVWTGLAIGVGAALGFLLSYRKQYARVAAGEFVRDNMTKRQRIVRYLSLPVASVLLAVVMAYFVLGGMFDRILGLMLGLSFIFWTLYGLTILWERRHKAIMIAEWGSVCPDRGYGNRRGAHDESSPRRYGGWMGWCPNAAAAEPSAGGTPHRRAMRSVWRRAAAQRWWRVHWWTTARSELRQSTSS
jgi:hypothetical protein